MKKKIILEIEYTSHTEGVLTNGYGDTFTFDTETENGSELGNFLSCTNTITTGTVADHNKDIKSEPVYVSEGRIRELSHLYEVYLFSSITSTPPKGKWFKVSWFSYICYKILGCRVRVRPTLKT